MRRIGSLDGLRGVAILLVVASHVGMPGRGGAVGVTLFFVLSGFLITSLLVVEHERTGAIRLARFYARRAYRLLPALFVYLLGAALIAAVVGHSAGWIWNETWPPLVYVANYAGLLGAELDMHWHAWSLAVEEHFYLIWPVLLLAIPVGKRIRAIGIGLVALTVWSLLVSSLTEWPHSSTDVNAYALAAGCLVAVAKPKLPIPSWAPLLGIVALVGTSAITESVLRQPLVVIVSAATIWACTDAEDSLLAASPLRFMGKVSYALYLWHVPLLMLAGRQLHHRVAAAAVSVGVAWLSWILVERPMLRRRDTLVSGPSTSVVRLGRRYGSKHPFPALLPATRDE